MRIANLVNRFEPFKFEFDGEVLEGEYYKYRTTTPSYSKAALASLPEVPRDGTEAEIEAANEARIEGLEKLGAKALADTIKSWNAEDENGQPLPPSVEMFEQLPQPFIKAFFRYLSELREGSDSEKKESASPSG